MISGKIYRLVCDDPNLVYIGSTTQTLNQRLSGHKKGFEKCKSDKLFEVGGVRIEMIEQLDFNNRWEMENRESYMILNTDNTTNKRPPPGSGRYSYCERCAEDVKWSDVIEHKKWHHHLTMR